MARKRDCLHHRPRVVTVTCVFLFLQMISYVASTCTNGQVDVNGDGSQCCDVCAPGYGVTSNCTIDNSTVCEKCVAGETFSSSSSHNSSCTKCSDCAKNILMHLVSPCNITHDAVCQCHAGTYFDADTNECKLCKGCPAGFGAIQMCNSRQNTECMRCKNGTYSNKLSLFSSCLPCSECTGGFKMLKSCTATEDTLCLNIRTVQGPPSNDSMPSVYNDDDDDSGDIIPVYCSILGLVVVGLLGYVIFKHWRRLQAKRRHKTRDPHEDVEYSKASGADSGVYVENESPKNSVYSLASRVRDLPHSKRKELEKTLATPASDSWKALAKELGYNNRRITQFETGKKKDGSGFKHFLHDWERQNAATVGCLIQALRNISRDDAARVVYSDTTEGRTQFLTQNSNVV